MAGKNFRNMRLQWRSRFLKWLLTSTALDSFVAIWLLGTLQISKISIIFTHLPFYFVVGFCWFGGWGGGLGCLGFFWWRGGLLARNNNWSIFAENLFWSRNTTLMVFTSCWLGSHREKQRRKISHLEHLSFDLKFLMEMPECLYGSRLNSTAISYSNFSCLVTNTYSTTQKCLKVSTRNFNKQGSFSWSSQKSLRSCLPLLSVCFSLSTYLTMPLSSVCPVQN